MKDRLLVAENKHGRAFKLGALDRLGIFGVNVMGEEMLGRNHLGIRRIGNFGGRSVRGGDGLGVEKQVACFILGLFHRLAIGVRNDAGKVRGGLVLDAEALPDFKAGERIKRNAAALAGLGRHGDARNGFGQHRFNALGSGGGGRIGKRRGAGAGESGEGDLMHGHSFRCVMVIDSSADKRILPHGQ